MSRFPLIDATCRVEQAQEVLSMWMEGLHKSEGAEARMIGALLSILDGVPETMTEAENELIKLAGSKSNG